MTANHVNFSAVQPSKGHDLLKIAAYNYSSKACGYDFGRKAGEYVGGCVLLPEGAPENMNDINTLWPAALAAEWRRDGVPARGVVVSLPDGLPPERALAVVKEAASFLVDQGLAVQVDVHNARRADRSGGMNLHAHLLVSTRPLRPEGFGPKLPDRMWREGRGRPMRQRWQESINSALINNGFPGLSVDFSKQTPLRGRRPDGTRMALLPEQNISRFAWQQFKKTGHNSQVDALLLARKQRAELKAAIDEMRAAQREVRAAEQDLHEAQHALDIRPWPNNAGRARKDAYLKRLLSGKYSGNDFPSDVIQDIQKVDLGQGDSPTTLHLSGGRRISDHGDHISLHGTQSPRDSARVIAGLVIANGWKSGIEIDGPPRVRQAVAVYLAECQPPIQVKNLSINDKIQVASEVEKRAALLPRAASESIQKVNKSLQDKGNSKGLEALSHIKRAVDGGDRATMRAAVGGDWAAAYKAAAAYEEARDHHLSPSPSVMQYRPK